MKTVLKTSLASLILSLLAFPAFAGTADIRAADSAVEFDAGGSALKYGESVNGATFDTETGWMPSLALGYSYLAPESSSLLGNLYLHADTQVSFGDSHYNGGLQDIFGNVTPYQGTDHNIIYHVSTRAGRLFEITEGVAVIPYIDLGFRSWRRTLTGPGGYNELYQEGEGMGGALLQVSPMQRLVLSLSGQLGSTFGSEMSTQGTTFNLGSTGVWQIGGKAGYALTPRFELTGSATLDGFGFGKSSLINGAYEPDSYTHQLSVMGGIAYHLY
jgi:hypothetical protein